MESGAIPLKALSLNQAARFEHGDVMVRSVTPVPRKALRRARPSPLPAPQPARPSILTAHEKWMSLEPFSERDLEMMT